MAILFFRVFARNRRRNTFRNLFWCLVWGSNPGFSSNKATHYLLDHGDFRHYRSDYKINSEILDQLVIIIIIWTDST